MIGTQILQGQGLGNRLFCYVTARSIAEQKKTSFGVPGKEILLNGLTGNNSEPFLDLWMGEEAKPEDFTRVYEEKEERIYTGACRHDLEHGCYVAGEDRGVFDVEDGTHPDGKSAGGKLFCTEPGAVKGMAEGKAGV